MSWYVRTQTGWGLRWILLGAFLVLFYRARVRAGSWGAISGSPEFWPLLTSAAILALIVLIFTVMTVTVKDGEIEVSMGLELIRKKIPVSDIMSVNDVAIPWHSVGIKKVSGGWLFSVAVSRGLDIALQGGRRVVIGSDDPEGLAGAIRSRMATPE
ncbi:MAG TPA: hypothetical protein ENN89_00200 [Synergistetes bacterium]|nr:hypothetical protein [Synergistota bacterium]